MLFRMTLVHPPFMARARVGQMFDWYLSVRHPVLFARMRGRQRNERRRVLQERRIAQEEERWLRLSAMPDERVVGFDPSWGRDL